MLLFRLKNAQNFGISKGIRQGSTFSQELIQSVLDWKEERNTLIHALLKQSLHTEDLRVLAEDGQQIVKTLNSKVTSFNRALQKESEE